MKTTVTLEKEFDSIKLTLKTLTKIESGYDAYYDDSREIVSNLITTPIIKTKHLVFYKQLKDVKETITLIVTND
jgi:uncharacterized membrane protein YGL010W